MFTNVSLLASILVENMERACKYDLQGCKVRLLGGKLEEHSRTCEFRLVSCPSHLCKKQLAFSHVIDHLLAECEHSFAKEDGSLQTVDKSYCITLSLIAQSKDLAIGLCDVTTIQWQGKFFFLNDTATLNSPHTHRNIYVQMLASKEECKKYKVTVSLEDKEGDHFLRYDNIFRFLIHVFPKISLSTLRLWIINTLLGCSIRQPTRRFVNIQSNPIHL